MLTHLLGLANGGLIAGLSLMLKKKQNFAMFNLGFEVSLTKGKIKRKGFFFLPPNDLFCVCIYSSLIKIQFNTGRGAIFKKY